MIVVEIAELVSAVSTTLGRSFTEAEAAQVEMWVGDALMRIRLRYGDRFPLLDEQVVAYVVREAVAAKVKQPDGLRRLSVSVDDGTVAKEWLTSSGQVTILDDWWDLLDSTLPDAGARDAFSIRLFPGGY